MIQNSTKLRNFSNCNVSNCHPELPFCTPQTERGHGGSLSILVLINHINPRVQNALHHRESLFDVVNLIPFTRIHFFHGGFAQLTCCGSQQNRGLSVPRVTQQMWVAKNTLCGAHPHHGRTPSLLWPHALLTLEEQRYSTNKQTTVF